MEFPLILYMSPEGPKWQPKYFAHPCRATAPTDHHTPHPEFKGVQFAPHGLVVNVPKKFSMRIHEEIHMYTKTAFMSAWVALGAAAVAGTLFAGSVAAKDQEFAVAYKVSTQGLDLSQPAGAHELYLRLQHAAEVVCTHGMRVDLAPLADPKGCYERALADAIRSAKVPLLTQFYLATHTLQEAAARGIDVPAQVAAN
jgi:UrcA family protein